MSKLVRQLLGKLAGMSTKQICIAALSVGLVGTVGTAVGVSVYRNSNSKEQVITEEQIKAEAEDMTAEELSDFLDNNAVDEETREELEAKLDEKYSKEDSTVASKPSENEKDETSSSEDKKDDVTNNGSSSNSKPGTGENNSSGSTGGNSNTDSKPNNGGSTNNGGSANSGGSSNNGGSTNKPSEPNKPTEPTKPSRPSGYSSSVTNEFWNQIDKGMVNNTFENAENVPRIHKDLKAKLDSITSGYVNKSKSANQTKNEINNIGWVTGWSYGKGWDCKPSDVNVSTVSVSGDLSAKQAGQEIYKKWTNGTWEIPYCYVNCKVYYEASNNTYVAYLVGSGLLYQD